MRETDVELRKTDGIGSDAIPFRVGIVPIAGFALMSYASTVEPLRAANLLSRRALYQTFHFSKDDTCRSSGDAAIDWTHRVGDMPQLDLLLVVAGGDPFAFDDAQTLKWLGRMAAKVPQIGGVSGGSVILARAGLM